MTYEELTTKLLEEGYEEVKLFVDYDYADAFVGVTTDNRAVYDYDKMVAWLMTKEGFTEEEAVEWIDYNTIRALPYYADAPIILERNFEEESK